MKNCYIAAFDQGTTSSRTIIFDGQGRLVSKAHMEFRQIYPKAGWVEHDCEDIYSSQMQSFHAALKNAALSPADITAIGVANQRETVVVWDRYTGKPVYNAIVWQCRRTSETCERLKKTHGRFVYERTGLNIDAYFSASKIAWIFENVPFARARAEKGDLLFGTVDTYLIWRLTGGRIHATDYTNASRTMLFNIHTLQWDEELLKLFHIPRAILPEVRPSSADFGLSDRKVVGAEIPVCAAVGDQQGALFGQMCVREGDVKNTYGTGCFLLMNTGRRAVASSNGLITTLTATSSVPDYALEGSVFIGGAVVQWLRDELKLIENSAETEEIAFSVLDTGGVCFIPAFVGLGAPHWNSDCRGMIYGITRGTTRAHIVRAALEAIAFQVFDVVHAMEQDVRRSIDCLCVDGGASANNFLMQFQADILNARVVRPAIAETTALGAAYLAGLCVGCYRSLDDLKNYAREARSYSPQIGDAERTEKLRLWEETLARELHSLR